MERYIAVDNYCAWPNLTLMPNGDIAALIFNQPSHGRWEGEVECWASTDGGKLWLYRGTPAPHEPGTTRLNVAGGLAHNGDLIAIVSGQAPKAPLGQPLPPGPVVVLPPKVCRSSDGGRTWERVESFATPGKVDGAIPFGDIVRSADGGLAVSSYSFIKGRRDSSAYFSRSYDDGRTWQLPVTIGDDDYNETDLLYLADGRWLAAARTATDAHLELFVSDDNGQSWNPQTALTLPWQHPGHLCQLADGRILLVYGIRNHGLYGVGARLSANNGKTWSNPIVLVRLKGATDGGYPSSVQLADGTIVTAYYASGITTHMRYHMGVVRWSASTYDQSAHVSR